MADWNNTPSLTQTYSAFVSSIRGRDEDTAKLFNGTGTNVPDQTFRWNNGNSRFEIYSSASTAWNPAASVFQITVSAAQSADYAASSDYAASAAYASTIPTAPHKVYYNAASITVTSFGDTLATVSSLNPQTGDVIMVQSRAYCAKGGTAGRTVMSIEKVAGTATLNSYSSSDTNISQEFYQDASDGRNLTMAGFFRVTSGGTLTLRLAGTSYGSNSASNSRALTAMILPFKYS